MRKKWGDESILERRRKSAPGLVPDGTIKCILKTSTCVFHVHQLSALNHKVVFRIFSSASNSEVYMTAQSMILRSAYRSSTFANELVARCRKWVINHLPRRCMLISIGLVIAGLGIPFLMALELIPITFFLGFLGLAFTSVGSILILYYA